MDLLTYATPIAAFSGIILSIISILYTQRQNKRRIEVNLEYNDSKLRTFEDPCEVIIEMSAFNSGFRSVAIVNYELFVNNKIINFTYENSYEDPNRKNVHIIIKLSSNNKLPYALKEGEIIVTRIKAGDLAKVLSSKIVNRKRLKGEVELSGYFETAENKKYWSKPLKFNIDEWRRC